LKFIFRLIFLHKITTHSYLQTGQLSIGLLQVLCQNAGWQSANRVFNVNDIHKGNLKHTSITQR